uniref:Uncharacterized protein AlNc14C31G2876 n=1 Tax=Albugo laibachii Nc14 TaxID=890382 RepID=F0W7S3_9STRA|nr:conserved hypothetical protein [Albugo laibachii Nc14]|eukprot:CCA17175.1 conserved hypothetical protein [Albugo laibachii Nc14]
MKTSRESMRLCSEAFNKNNSVSTFCLENTICIAMSFSFSSTPNSSGFQFGNPSNASSAPSGSALTSKPFAFGSTWNANPATTTPTFASPFGFNTSTPSTGNTFYGTPTPQPPITLETLFEDLPNDVKENIIAFQAFLKEQDQLEIFLQSISSENLVQLKKRLSDLTQMVQSRQHILARQNTSAHHIGKDVKHTVLQVDEASLILRSNMDKQNGSTTLVAQIARNVHTPSPFYWKLYESFENRMSHLKQQIEELQLCIQSDEMIRCNSPNDSNIIQSNTGQIDSQSITNDSFHDIFVQQNAALMKVASLVAIIHERNEKLRDRFLANMKQDYIKHGDAIAAETFKNPFEQSQKRNLAEQERRQMLDTIRFKTTVAPSLLNVSQPPAVNMIASTSNSFTNPSTTTPNVFGSVSAPTLNAPTKHVTFDFGTSAPAATTTPSFGFGTNPIGCTVPVTGAGSSSSSLFSSSLTDKKSKRSTRSKTRR